MQQPLSLLTERGRPNSIGFLRFLLASAVIYSHAFTLGRFGPEPLAGWTLGREKLGGLSVLCFFSLSGFLIAHSYATASSPWRYLWHRVLRIFPGFLVCLVVVAFGFAPLYAALERHGARAAFRIGGHEGAAEYVLYNAGLVIHRPVIAGVLRTTALPHVNGALWTLAYEFRCYLGVGLLGMAGLLTRYRRLGFGLVLGALTVAALKAGPLPSLWSSAAWLWSEGYLARLAAFFAAGVLAHLAARHVGANALAFVAAIAAVAISLHYPSWFYVVGPFAITYAILWLGLRLPLTWWDKPGDFSYGLYIYGFPVEQLLTAARFHRFGVAAYFLAAMALTTVLAVLSYKLIERPALRLKDAWRGGR